MKTGHKALGDLEAVMNHLATLGDKTHLLPPEKDKKTGLSSYRVEMNVQPAPMNLTRSSIFIEEIDEILDYKWLQSEIEKRDIGLSRAIREWLLKHRALWAAANRPKY